MTGAASAHGTRAEAMMTEPAMLMAMTAACFGHRSSGHVHRGEHSHCDHDISHHGLVSKRPLLVRLACAASADQAGARLNDRLLIAAMRRFQLAACNQAEACGPTSVNSALYVQR
jgi:hypothetical protein